MVEIDKELLVSQRGKEKFEFMKNLKFGLTGSVSVREWIRIDCVKIIISQFTIATDSKVRILRSRLLGVLGLKLLMFPLKN